MINKRYIISKKIGEGRSKVFNVIDTEFPEREVAAKFLPVNSSVEEKQKFREEYFTLQKLDHPNIIKAFELNSVILRDDEEDSEIDQFSPFITMEYFPAQELLNYYGLNEERILLSIVRQICSVLYYMHQSNYIYYDLKAENILVSENNNRPIVRLIDLGFAHYTNEETSQTIIGTPFYLAPELLKNEKHDHRVDFYSLGILLYRIVYGKFPFKSDKEIEIYKEQIEDEFELAETKYSPLLVKVIAKLLKKNPLERYCNALEIISDLHLNIDLDLAKDFLPAKIFSDRKDALNIISTYLKDKSSNEVFIINGLDGSGKSSLLQEVYYQLPGSILIENTKTKTGLDVLKYIFKKIILTETVYHAKEREFENIIQELCNDKSEITIETVKKVFNTLSADVQLLILLDDFNLYDDYVKEMLIQIIQILQVKGIKVILAESLDVDQATSGLNNTCDIQLNQFTEHQLTEFVELSYYRLFPKDELQKIILLYSDLLPGNIKQFIKDLILLRVLNYVDAKVTFEADEQTSLTLQSSNEELYRIRLSNLTTTELRIAQIISAFDISLEQTVLSAIMDISNDVLRNCLNELEKKNIIESLNLSNAPKINSLNFKKYIYSTINHRTKFHLLHGNAIKRLFPDFNTIELARQYELANEFEKSVEIIQKEIDKAEEIHAYSYKKILLEKSLKLHLSEKTTENLTLELISTYYKLSSYKSALENIYKLKLEKLPEDEKQKILLIKGSCLAESGNQEEGIRILNNVKVNTNDPRQIQKINVLLASAEFDMNNYKAVEDYFNNSFNDVNISLEDYGKLCNLMAMTHFYNDNIEKALDCSFKALDKYKEANLLPRIAAVTLNIGTFYDSIGNKKEAETYWQKALEINASIGNLEQEGSILINYGVFHHNNNHLEKAIENWNKAKIIFSSINIKNYYALSIGNIGEVNLLMCDYENSYSNLNMAINEFSSINNKDQEMYFRYILGKLHFIVGNADDLLEVINQFELESISSSEKLENVKSKQLLLKLLFQVMNKEYQLTYNDFEKNLNLFNSIEDPEHYVDILFAYSGYLILSGEIKKSLEISQLTNFKKIIEQNVILKSHQYYLFGKIAQQDQNLLELPAIEYFEKAYSLLEGESIIELTWKVLFEIANSYFERGNFYKAKQPRIYAFELINLIGENISNKKIRNAYFNHPLRKQAIERLVLIGNQSQINEYQKS